MGKHLKSLRVVFVGSDHVVSLGVADPKETFPASSSESQQRPLLLMLPNITRTPPGFARFVFCADFGGGILVVAYLRIA